VPRSRDKQSDGKSIRSHSTLLSPYSRRTRSIEELLPWLYLKGISTGDFSEALAALLVRDALGGALATDDMSVEGKMEGRTRAVE